MKYLLLLALIGCAKKTEFGSCIGVDGEEDPKLIYKYSTRNIIIGIVFVQLIAPPVIVALEATKCPVGVKP